MDLVTFILLVSVFFQIVCVGIFARFLRAFEGTVARLEETVDRMERATEVVADNLADSVSRADATIGPDGAAADAALRTGDTAEAITQRQDEAQ